jgi:hypothetical protein
MSLRKILRRGKSTARVISRFRTIQVPAKDQRPLNPFADAPLLGRFYSSPSVLLDYKVTLGIERVFPSNANDHRTKGDWHERTIKKSKCSYRYLIVDVSPHRDRSKESK